MTGATANLRSTKQSVKAASEAPAEQPAASQPTEAPAEQPTEQPANPILEILQALFKLSYASYYVAQAAHWHVRGPDFTEFHGYFGDEYEYWADKIDVIAEHIRTHRAFLPCCLPELAKGLPAGKLESDPIALTKTYLSYLNSVLGLVNKLNAAAETAKSPADIDLAGELAREIKKAIWKAESITGV